MSRILLPPFCLLLALCLLVVAICLLAVGAPDANVDLHAARAAGDDTFTRVWEADLARRQRVRQVTIGSAMIGSILLAISAFRSMR